MRSLSVWLNESFASFNWTFYFRRDTCNSQNNDKADMCELYILKHILVYPQHNQRFFAKTNARIGVSVPEYPLVDVCCIEIDNGSFFRFETQQNCLWQTNGQKRMPKLDSACQKTPGCKIWARFIVNYARNAQLKFYYSVLCWNIGKSINWHCASNIDRSKLGKLSAKLDTKRVVPAKFGRNPSSPHEVRSVEQNEQEQEQEQGETDA